MGKWSENDDRVAATRNFCEMLHKDPLLKAECMASAEVARCTFRIAGKFEDMPADIEVRVFDPERVSNDKLVVLVLPDPATYQPGDPADARSVWRCTWEPYKRRDADATK